MPNLLAHISLIVWPMLVLLLYATQPVGRATIWAILGAYLLLPVGAAIKISGIPPIDKDTVPNIAAVIGCSFIAGRQFRFGRGFGLTEVLLLTLLTSPFVTSELNTDDIVVGGRLLPGLGAYEGLSATVGEFLFVIPFFLARNVLRSPKDIADLFRAMVIAGLAYSLLELYEVRMSPQLHAIFYGYPPHDFIQQVRQGGYRPMVFLGHGLLVAFFTMTTAVAAAALWRTRYPLGSLPVTGWLTGMLVLCKSAGALVYGIVLIPLVRFMSPRLQVNIALVLVAIAMLYPVLRATDLFPTRSLTEFSDSLSSGERAASLQFRFDNEDKLLARATERPIYGWGRFGRNRVYSAENGDDESVTDGVWIIVLGTWGLVGFVAQFGLLALTVVRASWALEWAKTKEEQIFIAALALIIAVNMIDLLPNSSLSPWTWLLAGALLGRAENMRARPRVPRPAATTSLRPGAVRTSN